LTELSTELTSIGIQIHGGMGFIEETGAAQFLRDGRITAIYEGTNGIQANDLVGRKLLRDGGQAMQTLLEELRATCSELQDNTDLGAQAENLSAAVDRLEATTRHILELGRQDSPAPALANAFNYLMQAGYVLGGWYAARIALAAAAEQEHAGPSARARCYNGQLLPRAEACASAVLAGPAAILEPDIEQALAP